MKWSRGFVASFMQLARAADPRRRYRALYRGKVVKFDAATQKVDVMPDDPALPPKGMGGLELRGFPGARFRVTTGTSVLIGWENGDPARPFACLWAGDAHVEALTLNADALVLGGENGAQPVPLGEVLHALLAVIKNHTHGSNGGGPIVVSPELQAYTDWDVRSSKVKAN